MKSLSVMARQIASGRGADVDGVDEGGRSGRGHRVPLQVVLQVDQGGGRPGPVLVEPAIVEPPDRDRVEVVVLLAADAARRHEAGRLEDAQVLHDAEAGHPRHRHGQLPERAAVALEEEVQQVPAGGIRQGAEDRVVHGPKSM